MGWNPKLFIREKVYLATSRMEEGLPLVPHKVINEIIWGIIARAQRIYPVEIIAILFMKNHYHCEFVALSPESAYGFHGYVKQELAHAVNKMLGRSKRTVWEEGYDSPIVLTAYDAMRYLTYIYTNPQRACQVDSIDEYPGVSTWGMMINDTDVRECRWIRRKAVPLMPEHIDEVTDNILTEEIINNCKIEQSVRISPWGWLRCFSSTRDSSPAQMKTKLVQMVRSEELALRKKRVRDGTSVVGADNLKKQSIAMQYTPQKRGKRMICLCSDASLRIDFIVWFKQLAKKARETYKAWKAGDRQHNYPVGMFPPNACAVAHWLPSAFVT